MYERLANSTQLRRTRPADAHHASRLRRDLDAWLHEGSVPVSETRCAEVLLGVNEALANCAEHAYLGRDDGDITMHASYDGAAHRLRVRISDRGSWRSSSTVSRRRGRGLALMRALSDQCSVHRSDDGTTVNLDYDLSTESPS